MKKIALWEAKHPKTVLLLAVLLLIPVLRSAKTPLLAMQAA